MCVEEGVNGYCIFPSGLVTVDGTCDEQMPQHSSADMGLYEPDAAAVYYIGDCRRCEIVARPNSSAVT